MENFQKGIKTNAYTKAPAGLLYPGDPGFPNGNTGLNKQWLNFAPRIGLAWDVTGTGRTAIRSSYGIGYDFQAASYLFVSTTAPPFANRVRVNNPPGGLDDPWGATPGGSPHPVPAQPTRDASFPSFGAFGALSPDINSERAQSWNLIVEQQIGKVWQVSAGYLGSRIDRIWQQVAINPGVYLGLGPCTLPNGVSYPVCSTNTNLDNRRVLSLQDPVKSALLGPIDENKAVGIQNYDALRLSMQRRSASGLRLSGNYTRARCVGNAVQTTFGQVGSGLLKPDDPAFDVGNCSTDRRHIANLTAGIQTPQFSNGAVRALASDWTISGILNARSGNWLTITTSRDIALSGISGQRVNVALDNPFGARTLNNYLNPAAFSFPAPGTLGNSKRGSVMGPAYWTIDLSLARVIGLTSRQNVELRIETFNLLNHFNWGNPATSLDSATFGQIQSQSGSSRVLQFGVKYGF
jgi:hypothetical protein